MAKEYLTNVRQEAHLKVGAGGDDIHILGAGAVQVQDQCHPLWSLPPGVVHNTDGHCEGGGALTGPGSLGVKGGGCAGQV